MNFEPDPQVRDAISQRQSFAGQTFRLFHFPASLCSQKVRLALLEKGVAWHSRPVNLLRDANLDPAYVQINPRAVVPTLQAGELTVIDSATILEFIDSCLPGPALLPGDESARELAMEWIRRQDQLPMSELSLARLTSWQRSLVRRLLGQRADRLKRLARQHPELDPVWQRKNRELQHWLDILDNPDHSALDTRIHELLDDLEAALQRNPWLAGDSYSLADTAMTAIVERLRLCGYVLSRSGRRPALERWWRQVRRRPSYRDAIARWKKPRIMLPYLAPLVLPKLLPILVILLAFALFL